MMELKRWAPLIGAVFSLATNAVFAQTIVDFESAAYVADHTISNVDTWTFATSDPITQYPDNFKIQAGPEGKWLHALSTSQTTTYRPMPNQNGFLAVRWKWRPMSDSVSMCLGVSSGVASARTASRALACLTPNGGISYQGALPAPTATVETWKTGAWLYMDMLLDFNGNKFTLLVANDSLRGDERVAGSAVLGSTGNFTRVVIRDESGGGYVDIDDIAWDAVAAWQPPNDNDTSWSSNKNWSTNAVPDSSTHVLFPDATARGCMLDKSAVAKSITVMAGYKGAFVFGSQSLTVYGRADFSGGSNYTYADPGAIHISGTHAQPLVPPASIKVLPPIVHDGSGVLRLQQRALFTYGLTQNAGAFDFNGFDLNVQGALLVQNGQPNTLRNLDGRTLSVTGGARLYGTSHDVPLGLASTAGDGTSAAKGWTLSYSGTTDSLVARYAILGNARTPNGNGYAYQCADAGGNSGWTFMGPPAIAANPKDISAKVGEGARFSVTASGPQPISYQWMRNNQDIASGGNDSIYTLAGVRKADSGASFSCRVTNSQGSVSSQAAVLRVSFPAPTALPAPQTLVDSLHVALSPSVPGAIVWYSRNGAPYAQYAAAFTLYDSTTVRAFAVFNGDTSAPASWTYPKQAAPQLPKPTLIPANTTSFTDSLVVALSSGVNGASIYYTTDQTDPDSSAKDLYTQPFTIKATTTVSAAAYMAGYRHSDIQTVIYIQKQSQSIPVPTATPAGASFSDSIWVKLSPPAAYPQAVIYYFLPGGGPVRYSDSILIRQTLDLKAIAISSNLISDTAAWTFTKRLGPPVATPKGSHFTDTLRVRLSDPSLPDAPIYYTLDGSDPAATSKQYTAQGILLDSSATLKAIAIQNGASAILSEDYFLTPDTPSVSARGGDYSARISLTLAASSPRATIYYTLDGSAPGPDRPQTAYAGAFNLDSSATLKAVAVAGKGAKQQIGPMLIQNYTFISPGVRTLGPGQHINLSSNYGLTSPMAGAAPVTVEVLTGDSLKGVKGFRDIVFGMRLSVPEGSTAFPKVVFTAPSGELRSLYSYSPSDKTVRWLSNADSIDINAPGTYFLGIDTAAPVITFSGESFQGDSTRLGISIMDNVSNLTLDVRRSDDSTQNVTGREITSPMLLSVTLKAPAGSIAPLTIRINVEDHSRASSFPADGSFYALKQHLSGPVHSPAAFHIGAKASAPWDLVAIPLALDPPLTMAGLRTFNSASGLQGDVLDTATGQYRVLKDNEAILPGSSVWLAAPNSIPSLAFPSVTTASRNGASGYKLTLHKGWNQVANPGLVALYWPVTRKVPDSYDASLLKGLHYWDAVNGTYVDAESLDPWRGYYAHYAGARDTVIDLRTSPVPVSGKIAAAPASGSASGFSFRLNLGLASLRLGAGIRAADGLGVEDEASPPAPAGEGARLYAQRAGAALETDLLHWAPGALLTWRVVAGLGNTQVTLGAEAARVESLSLPQGYAVWAVSRTRGMRFDLAGGIPLAPGFTDTLDVVAGPAQELEARLHAVPKTVDAFGLTVSAEPGGMIMHLALPQAAQMHWALLTLDGRRVDGGNLTLPQGVYHLARGRAYPAGMYFLSVETGGTGMPAHLARKLAIP